MTAGEVGEGLAGQCKPAPAAERRPAPAAERRPAPQGSGGPAAEGRRLPQRVVSLVPSVTETLLAWGVRPAGVTRFCEAPGVPSLGGTKNPDVAAVVALQPDLVVMDRQENRLEDARALEAAGLKVLATDVRSLEGLGAELERLARAVGVAPPPALEPGDLPDPFLRAWVPIWRRPWMSIGGGTYASSLLRAAGIANVLAASPEPYPRTGPEEAAALHPDVVLAPSEPYPFRERHRAELEAVAPVVFLDGQDLFWWGARTPTALERLRRLASSLGGQAP